MADDRLEARGALYLLPCGRLSTDDGALLESGRLSAVLESLGEMFDLVLIDAPPLLTGDAMSLSTKVDAIVVVTKLGIQRQLLHELASELLNAPATPIGFVLTGVERGAAPDQPDGARREPVPAKTEPERQPVEHPPA
jgi:Mrp family chromosome partitioning ATPase